jgi:hypothetical protein
MPDEPAGDTHRPSRPRCCFIEGFYNRASEHPSVYVREEALLIGMRSRGVFWVLSRALGDRDVERAARLKIQGPSGNREIEMRMFFLVGVSLGALMTPALAADMAPYYKVPPVAQGFNWTGFYIGGDVGGAWSSIAANGFGTNNASGVIAGVYGGYNWQIAPQWLIGIEDSPTVGALGAPAILRARHCGCARAPSARYPRASACAANCEIV